MKHDWNNGNTYIYIYIYYYQFMHINVCLQHSDLGVVVGGCLLLRWWAQSFYVYGVDESLPKDLKRNSNGGVTISFRKRGGVEAAWSLAKIAAKWESGDD